MLRKIKAIQPYHNFTNEISVLFNITYEFTIERFVTLNLCYKSRNILSSFVENHHFNIFYIIMFPVLLKCVYRRVQTIEKN